MTRGEIWLADLGVPFGSEPGFARPVLIVQDNAFNKSKIRTVIVASITTNLELAEAPANVFLPQEDSGLTKDSVINISQIAAIDRTRLVKKLSKLDYEHMNEAEAGLKMVLGLHM